MTYVVVEMGAHISDVYGPFTSCRAARTVGNRLASKETDDWLVFTVRKLYKRGGIGTRVFGKFRGKRIVMRKPTVTRPRQ